MTKIDIYYKKEYICSTISFKTCKLAKKYFQSNLYKPHFKIEEDYKPKYINDLLSKSIDITQIKARFSK